jgi:ferredoxin-NADP reductase
VRDERDRKLRRQQAVEDKHKLALMVARREQAERRSRQDEVVMIHTTRMRKAICLAELKARVPVLLSHDAALGVRQQRDELARRISAEAAADGTVLPVSRWAAATAVA